MIARAEPKNFRNPLDSANNRGMLHVMNYPLGINVRHLDTDKIGHVARKYDGSNLILVRWQDGSQELFDEFQQIDELERVTK